MNVYEIIDQWLAEERVLDVYVVSRYTYRIGRPLLPDHVYEGIQKFVASSDPHNEYLLRSYDDDPIPYSLMRDLGMEDVIPSAVENSSGLYRYLDSEKSLSIRSIVDYSEAYMEFMKKRARRLRISIKVDGIFVKKLILENELALSLSRGRTGNAHDLTKNIRKVLKRFFPELGGEEVKVYSEAYVETDKLEYLKEKYDWNLPPEKKRFKTEKSGAISMLCGDMDLEDYCTVKCLSFDAEGLGSTLTETTRRLEELGFQVVPHIFIDPMVIPEDFEQFKSWLEKVLADLWMMKGSIPSDGIVVEEDEIPEDSEIKGQYSDKNFALKMENWEFKKYQGEVVSIHIEQKRVECNCRAELKPVYTADGTKATFINSFNLGLLMRNGIKVGSVVNFERNSGAVNILLTEK